MNHIVIIGSGSLGTAFAAALTQTGRRISLWGRDPETIQEITEERTNNHYLPGVKLPEGFLATTDRAIWGEADVLLLAVPSRAFRTVCQEISAAGLKPGCVTLSGTKGIELQTGMRMTEVLKEVFPDHSAAVISGPSHAEEVARSVATALVIGSPDEAVALALQDLFTLPWLRSYTSNDVVGIEIGGTVKNIVAIAGGIVDGLGFGGQRQGGVGDARVGGNGPDRRIDGCPGGNLHGPEWGRRSDGHLFQQPQPQYAVWADAGTGTQSGPSQGPHEHGRGRRAQQRERLPLRPQARHPHTQSWICSTI